MSSYTDVKNLIISNIKANGQREITGPILQDVLLNMLENSSEVEEILYNDLKALRDQGKLTPSRLYRIIDYITTTTQSNTRSAGHPFDVIVLALSETELSEQTWATLRTGDTYFANNDLNAWQLWYCLDNDTNRFAWADGENGKGVIYRMIDEFGNDCPYDFKNIQFYRQWNSSRLSWSIIPDNTIDAIPCYTFSSLGDESTTLFKDMSLDASNRVHYNTIKEYIKVYKQFLNNICFFGKGCYSNTFGNNCLRNTFGNNCYFNTFGSNCSNNTFGNSCFSNTFGNYCYSNTFGNSFQQNTFGNYCYSNIFGNSCYYNTFENGCNSNTFGNDCYSNTFGNNCQYNTLGSNCSNNTFGNYCRYIKFASDSSAATKYSYYKHNHFGDGCQYIVFTGEETSGDHQQVQNYNFSQGLQGTSSAYLTIDGKRNLSYETYVSKDTDGTIKESVIANTANKEYVDTQITEVGEGMAAMQDAFNSAYEALGTEINSLTKKTTSLDSRTPVDSKISFLNPSELFPEYSEDTQDVQNYILPGFLQINNQMTSVDGLFNHIRDNNLAGKAVYFTIYGTLGNPSVAIIGNIDTGAVGYKISFSTISRYSDNTNFNNRLIFFEIEIGNLFGDGIIIMNSRLMNICIKDTLSQIDNNTSKIQTLEATKQDVLTAGKGIVIDGNNTISINLDPDIFKVVSTLPEAPDAGDEKKIHLVPSDSGESGNAYDEYIYVDGSWEKIGSFRPSIDLSDLVDFTSEQTITATKTFSGGINMNSTKILNVATPTNSNDAVNKQYVDAQIRLISDKVNYFTNAGYLYAGIATPEIDPGTLEAKVFYIANGKGTYTNFGGLEVTEDEVVVLYYDTEWHKVATGIASKEKLTELSLKVGEFKVKDASVSGNTLNITKDDGTILPFTPQGGGDDWQVLELNTADIPEDRILLDVGEGKIITDVDIDFAFSTNTPLAVAQEFRIGFLNTIMGSGYGNIIRHSFGNDNTKTISGKYIGEVIKVNNVKMLRTRSGWTANSSNAIDSDGTGSGWSSSYSVKNIYGSIADLQNYRYLQIYNYYPTDTIVFGWVKIKYKTANV